MRLLPTCWAICAIAIVALLAAQSPQANLAEQCVVSRHGVRLACPIGWGILTKSNEETIIGNYIPSPDIPKNVFGGPSKAWLTFKTLPAHYKDLAEWIFAGKKIAPESVENKLTVRNQAAGDIAVVCLSSSATSGTLYTSYFFQIGQTPVLLELNYGAGDQKKDEYRSAAVAMIETAQSVK